MSDISLSNNSFNQYLFGLSVFEVVARHGNFTAASKTLGLTQSSISQRIKRLESDLGVALFTRKSRGVELTNEGLRLLYAISPAMSQLHDSVTTLLERKLRPRVRISADFAFSTFWLMPRLSHMRSELNDEVEIQILASQVPPQEGIDDCDISIHVGDIDNMRKGDVLLLEERVAAVCSPAYLEKIGCISSAEALLDTQLISLSRPPSAKWQTWQGWFSSLGINDDRSKNYFSVNNYDMVTQAAVAGEGVALGWIGLIDELLRNRSLVKAADDVVLSNAGYIMSIDQNIDRRGPDKIFEWIASQVKENPAT
ncbi:MAG: LysR family transcriptional regulator [Pseudomonadota bacterium]